MLQESTKYSKVLSREVLSKDNMIENEDLKLYQAIANMQEGFIRVIDYSHRLVFINDSFSKYLGYENKEMIIGMKCYELFQKRSIPCPNCQLQAAINSRNTEVLKCEIFEQQDSNYSVKKEIISLKPKCPQAFYESYTEKQVELSQDDKEFVKYLSKKEKDLTRLKRNFVNMISHEYRTPLAIISTSSFILQRYINDQKDSPLIEHLGKIQSSINIMTSMLENVLKLDQDSSNIANRMRTEIDLNFLCEHIIEEVSIIDKKKHNLYVEAHQENIRIYTDQRLLQQALTNLLLNAIKYSVEGSDVKIKLAVEEEEVRIDICDKGIGISLEDREKIFKAFYKPESQIGIYPGTGLGLTLTKNFINALGGSIYLDSEVEKGSKFTVLLPIKI